jgi:hypothetical protein
MRAEDVRRWAEARRSAEEHELRSAGAAPEPQAAWLSALSLFSLLGRMVGWPVPPDPIREREDATAAQAWTKLRAAYRRRA